MLAKSRLGGCAGGGQKLNFLLDTGQHFSNALTITARFPGFLRNSEALMAKTDIGQLHSVRCTIKIPKLTKSGSAVKFEVHAEGVKIGTIVIGSGSITWAGGKRKNSFQIPWSEFATMMDEHCYG